MESKELGQILAMNGGDGAFSYDTNTRFTGTLVNRLSMPFREDLIKNSKVFPTKVIRIADLGCASAQNSFDAMQTIVSCLKRLYQGNNISLPEIQIFFNDLPSNDFNHLFRSLPSVLAQSEDDNLELPRCFSAAVAGSFYGRLFPRDSLHFAHSAIALHWLSQVPVAVRDKNLEAWNKGQIFISAQSTPAVTQAYLAQFNNDLSAFLRARGDEMVEGGRMFLVLAGRESSDLREQFTPFKRIEYVLKAAFRDLVTEGLMEEEKLDSFNLPLFSPSIDEVKTIVESEGSFIAERIELLEVKTPHTTDVIESGSSQNPLSATSLRSKFEKLIEANIGAKLTELLFQKVEEKGPQVQKQVERECRSPAFMLSAILVRATGF